MVVAREQDGESGEKEKEEQRRSWANVWGCVSWVADHLNRGNLRLNMASVVFSESQSTPNPKNAIKYWNSRLSVLNTIETAQRVSQWAIGGVGLHPDIGLF